MVGSRMFIYKQDPSIKEPGMRSTFIPSKVLKGPKDELVRIADVRDIDPDENGDFLITLENDNLLNTPEDRLNFDAVHAFAVCRQVLTMYQRAFNRLDILEAADKNENGVFDFKRKWGKPLDIYIRAFDELKAVYTSGLHTIFLGYSDTVFSCRSFDIIAHETGHAVFDAFKQGYKINQVLETQALEESFCDLTSVFALLSQMDICEACIALSKGNLSPAPNFLFIPNIGEEYGAGKIQQYALRNISQKRCYDKTIADPNCDRYDLSLVFSSAIYNFLVEIFKDHVCPQKYDPAETLFWSGRMITEITIGAFYKSLADIEYSFKSVGLEMIHLLADIESNRHYHDSLNNKRRWSIKLLKIFHAYNIL